MKGKRQVHPNALRAEVDQLFSEIIEVDKKPEDYMVKVEVNGKQFETFNDSKYLRFHYHNQGKDFIRVKVDRRDPIKLRQVIEKQLKHYLDGHEDREPGLFKSYQLEKLNEYQNRLCPNYEKPNHTDELKLFKDLESYRTVLIETVEGKPKIHEPHENKDFDEYLENWVNSDTTLIDWRKWKVDHWDLLDQMRLEKDLVEEIEQHQFNLFHKAVRNQAQNLMTNIVRLIPDNRAQAISEHLRLIDSFVQSETIKTFTLELIKEIIHIREFQYLDVLKCYQKVVRQTFTDVRTDCVLFVGQKPGNADNRIHCWNPYFIAQVIFQYRQNLVEMSQPSIQSPSTRKHRNDTAPPPFLTGKILKHFKYLNVHYANDKKVRWTYLYHEIKKYDQKLGEAEYFRFVIDNYQADLANRLQPNANLDREEEKLRELSKQFERTRGNEVQE